MLMHFAAVAEHDNVRYRFRLNRLEVPSRQSIEPALIIPSRAGSAIEQIAATEVDSAYRMPSRAQGVRQGTEK